MSLPTEISHTDFNFPDTHAFHEKSHTEDEVNAQRNLGRFYPGETRGTELADRLAGILQTERTRRSAHYYRYRAMLRIANNEPLFSPDDNKVAETSLSDFHIRMASLDDDGLEYARMFGGKGISAELGHVDQLGDWGAGKPLDAAIRQLPHSTKLSSEGFLFGETYDSKDNAQINYRFHLADLRSGGRGVSLKGVRKRAAADVLTEDGSIFEIVKQSTFLVDIKPLDDRQRAKLGTTLQLQDRLKGLEDQRAEKSRLYDAQQRLDDAAQAAGEVVIEPFITDPELRAKSTAVLAATCLYFALYRHR